MSITVFRVLWVLLVNYGTYGWPWGTLCHKLQLIWEIRLVLWIVSPLTSQGVSCSLAPLINRHTAGLRHWAWGQWHICSLWPGWAWRVPTSCFQRTHPQLCSCWFCKSCIDQAPSLHTSESTLVSISRKGGSVFKALKTINSCNAPSPMYSKSSLNIVARFRNLKQNDI